MKLESKAKFSFILCTNNECQFRFPIVNRLESGEICPRCGANTLTNAIISNEDEGRSSTDPQTAGLDSVRGFLDNIRSGYNVGSILRTADGAGVQTIYLAGITPTPDHPKVAKTSLGASRSVSFSYHRNGLNEILELQKEGWEIWSLENTPDSQSIFNVRKIDPAQGILLVVGNELAGIDPSILEVSDRVFSLPMHGKKESLNVSVAFGIAIYWLRYIQASLS